MKINTPPTAPVGGERLGEYLGSDLVLMPLRTDVIDTVQGESPVTICKGWSWTGTALNQIGEVMVFWSRVRAQLAPFVDSGEAVMGKLIKNGRAYELADSTPDVAAAMTKALEALESADF